MAITIITGIVFYKADIKVAGSGKCKGIWSALIILLIVWTAILLYQVADGSPGLSCNPQRDESFAQ